MEQRQMSHPLKQLIDSIDRDEIVLSSEELISLWRALNRALIRQVARKGTSRDEP
jgi:hypothetical protein